MRTRRNHLIQVNEQSRPRCSAVGAVVAIRTRDPASLNRRRRRYTASEIGDPSGETHFEEVKLRLDEADYRPPTTNQWFSFRMRCKPARCNLSDCPPAGWAEEYLAAAAPVLDLWRDSSSK